MKLYVMRHGTAEDQSPGGDSARALTPQGRDRVREVARALVDAGEAPKLIVASPLVRALQTAEIVHAHSKVEAPVQVHPAIAPNGDSAELARELASQGKKRVMFVGHEPDCSMLVSMLAGRPLVPSFGKAMVIGLRIPNEGGDAEARFVLDAKTLNFTRFGD